MLTHHLEVEPSSLSSSLSIQHAFLAFVAYEFRLICTIVLEIHRRHAMLEVLHLLAHVLDIGERRRYSRNIQNSRIMSASVVDIYTVNNLILPFVSSLASSRVLWVGPGHLTSACHQTVSPGCIVGMLTRHSSSLKCG